MENVYGCGALDYTSDPINLKDFLKDSSSLHHPFLRGPLLSREERENLRLAGKITKEEINRERLMDAMNSTLTDSDFLDLESICSADHLQIEGQQPSFDATFIKKRATFFEKADIPTDLDLQTIHNLNSRNRIHERFLKYAGSIWLDKLVASSNNAEEANRKKEVELVPGGELYVVVRLYLPFWHKIGARSHKIAVGGQEVVILGMQTLADLRDAFHCKADNAVCQDLSLNPTSTGGELAKNKYKSGMMYINNIFYNDTRDPSNLDYSQVVREWAESRGLYLGTTASMESTRINELTVRLGYPYLYQHQGSCEHLFCFSDVRLLHQSDPLRMAFYPMLRSLTKTQSHYCMMCGLYVAKWITIRNTRVPHDPCYFCQTCFMSFNYINKKKVGDFTAYPFYDNSAE